MSAIALHRVSVLVIPVKKKVGSMMLTDTLKTCISRLFKEKIDGLNYKLLNLCLDIGGTEGTNTN